MRAVVFHRHGGPEVLETVDLPVPEPGPGEVRVRLHAAALNHLDLFVREGIPGLRLQFPHVPGSDGAGVLDAVGEGVEAHFPHLTPGLRVVINPSLSCMECRFCRAGEHSLCEAYRILGEHVDGTYREYLTVPARNVKPFPESWSFEEAAAGILTYLTAWRMLMTRAGLRPGERVLIQGIGGGVALACLQIARFVGAEVWVTSGSEEKLARARELGAAWGVLYRDPEWARKVWKRTEKKGLDVVVDCSGTATFSESLKLLRPGGRLVTCGATTGPKAEVDIRYIFWRQLTIVGSTMSNLREFDEVTDLMYRGAFRPVVDRVLPLEEAREAQIYLAEARQFGKVVLRI